MLRTIKKIAVIALSLVIITGVFAPMASVLAATFNNDPQDYATLQVSNYTKTPGSNSNWSNAVSANAGEVISFLAYYHNTASDTANNVRIRVQLPSNAFTSQTLSGEVFADASASITSSALVNLSANQSLTFIPGSVSWYPNQLSTPQPLLAGQNGSEIVSANGLLIGNLAAGWGAQGYVVFRAQVGTGSQAVVNNTAVNIVGRSPYVTTKIVSSITNNSVFLRGAMNANGTASTAWFEYGNTPALGSVSATQALGQSGSSIAYSIALNGLQEGTPYYYRAVAQNAYGTTYGKVLNFSTSGVALFQNNAQRGTVATNSIAVHAPVALSASLNTTHPSKGETVVYTLAYENNTNAALKNAHVRVVIPKEISFVGSSGASAKRNGDTVTFTLGTVAAHRSGFINATLSLNETTKTSEPAVINATLDYSNTRKAVQTVSASFIFPVYGSSAGLASLSSVIGSLFGNWFMELLLGLLLGAGIYHFFIREKEESITG